MIEMNTYHLTHIKADFLKNTGKRVAFLSKLPITYKSSKYARESFNADTVITYPLKMWEKYENKYTHCLVILIQNDIVVVSLFIAYTLTKELRNSTTISNHYKRCFGIEIRKIISK